ncbi:hypothetical protein [Botryobacter ruber]|nr:hypothetical protein [Botryobacter ruber]
MEERKSGKLEAVRDGKAHAPKDPTKYVQKSAAAATTPAAPLHTALS